MSDRARGKMNESDSMRHKSDSRRSFWWLAVVVLAATTLIGCDAKTIQNLGDIDVGAVWRIDGIHVEIALLTETGDRLYWDNSILGPTGERVLPASELDTKVTVWSLRNGQRHAKVYAGRLAGLRWQSSGSFSYRSLIGVIPQYAIQDDPESDSIFGEMDVTLVTPKQGEFSRTAYNVQIDARTSRSDR